MGFLDFLKKDKWRYVMQGNLNTPVWNTQKDKQFITEGYNRVVWVYACVGAISSAVSSVPWLLYRKGRAGRLIEVTDHPILTMLNNRANPYMSSKDFLDYWATYLAIEGKFYAEYSNPTMPTGLYPIYPHYVHPIPHKTEFIGGFEYRLDEPFIYKPNELLWSKFNDPLDVYQGQSPIRALARTIDTENEAVNWNKSTLQNAGVPAGVFQIQNPSPELSLKLEEEWKKRYAGGSNSRKPLILNSDKASYMPLGLSPVDMDFLNQRKVNRIEICSAFGVPSQIVGDPEGQTYSNYGEAQKAFWENTIIAKYLEHIKDKLQSDLLPRYADNLELRYDLSNVGALKENEDKKAMRVMNLWKSGLIKRNEGRYALDYEEDLTQGDLYFNEIAQINTQSTGEVKKKAEIPVMLTPSEYGLEVEEPEEEVDEDYLEVAEPEEMEDEEEKEIENQNNIVIIINNLIEKALKKKEPTNFPKVEDNETISLVNSSYELFPLDYAESLRENYPSIWERAGNIQGNDTYRVIKRIREEDRNADELTINDQDIIKMREAWSARHYEDFRLNGVIAQIKWHMIGSRGLDHMKNVIDEAKRREDEKKSARIMKVDEQREYFKSFDGQREKFVTKTRRELKAMFEDERDKILRAIKGKQVGDVIAIADEIIDADKVQLRTILTAMNIAVIDEFGTRITNEYGTKKYQKKLFDPYSEFITAWITKNIANAVVLVTDTTKREIREIVNSSIMLGLPIGSEDQEGTIAWAIGNLYLDQIIPNRSETIARTEVNTASNQGSLEGARQLGTGLQKYWIPTFDDDTRDTHLEMANKEPIGLDEEFLVGGSRGQAPSAPTLSAKERINCRCTIGYVEQKREGR